MTKEERAELWRRIQTEEPKLAELLEAIRGRFGKPELEVRWKR